MPLLLLHVRVHGCSARMLASSLHTRLLVAEHACSRASTVLALRTACFCIACVRVQAPQWPEG